MPHHLALKLVTPLNPSQLALLLLLMHRYPVPTRQIRHL